MERGDLIQRKGTPEWKAIITKILNEFHIEFIWLESGERDKCSKLLMEVINESR